MHATGKLFAVVLAGVGGGVMGGGGAWGLGPADVAVVFNTKSASSLQIARYYLNARHLPQDHLIPLTCDVGENISEDHIARAWCRSSRKAWQSQAGAGRKDGKRRNSLSGNDL